jgi:penicillin-binding protein 1C
MIQRHLPVVLACIIGTAATALWLMLCRADVGLPPFTDVRDSFRPSDNSLLDRHGNILHERRLDFQVRRLAWTSLADISPALQAAVIATEDRRFYRHAGVDSWAIVGSVARRLVGKPLRGASTISMQLTTLIDPELRQRRSPRTILQKWLQIRLALALERCWSKAEILEAYLNLVSYRGELQGIAAAASVLFGKAPHGITPIEAAILAVLLRGPNAEPAIIARRVWALLQTHSGAATAQDITISVERAVATPVSTGPRAALAPHVAQRVLRPTDGPRSVSSTLDSHLQAFAAETLRRHLLGIRAQHVYDGAVLVVENYSGDVLAYVAGSGDLSSARHVDGIQARRQAGSLLKPFLYGMAIERKMLTPASLLEDEPLNVPVVGGLYRPRNYDEGFRGLVSVRTALAGSLNIPAVRTLGLVGAEDFVEELRRLGLDGANESGDYYGPSLALGSVDASLWELLQAYRTLANGGMWSPLRLTPGEPATQSGRRVYSEATTFLLSHILSDRDSRSITFGLESPLATRFWSAVKTGTSQEMRDNWCIGYTRYFTVGVWVGNLSGEPMRHVSGVVGAAPIWGDIVAWLHRTTPSSPMAPPTGVVERQVGFPGGIEPERHEWFLRGTEPLMPQKYLAGGIPQVRTPVSGEVIALDPDIPAAHQRIVFMGDDASVAQRWVLNGQELGAVAGPLLWEPIPGQHTLSLVDDERRVLDTVRFEVRPSLMPGDLPPSATR